MILPLLLAPATSLATAFLPAAPPQGIRVNGPLPRGTAYEAEDTIGFRLSPDGAWAAFFADIGSGNDLFELFGVPTDGSGPPRRLNRPLVAGGSLVRIFQDPFEIQSPLIVVTPQNRVVYAGDQDVNDVVELYSVPVDGSASPVTLSGPTNAAADVGETFVVSEDGSRVVFYGDLATDNVFELWSAPTDGGAPPTRLSATGAPPYNLNGLARISPDGSWVVYQASLSGQRTLVSVPSDGSAPPVALHPPFVSGGLLGAYEITPDGSQVLYVASQAVFNQFELWRVPIDGSAAPLRVNGPMIANGDVLDFSFSPAGTHAIYTADETLDDAYRVFSFRLDGSTAPVPLGPGPVTGRRVVRSAVSPEGSRVAFVRNSLSATHWSLITTPIDGGAPHNLTGELMVGTGPFWLSAPPSSRAVFLARPSASVPYELYSVPLDGSSEPVLLSQDSTGGGIDPAVFLAPDDSRVVYRSDARVLGRDELWSVPIEGGVPPVRLNGRLVHDGDVQGEIDGSNVPFSEGYAVSANGRVVYRADERTNETYELWSVPVDRSAASIPLSGALESGPVLGDVQSVAWTPDGTTLVYTADEEANDFVTVHSVRFDPRDPLALPPPTVLSGGVLFAVSPDSMFVAQRGPPICDPVPFCSTSASLLGGPVDGSTPVANWSPSTSGVADVMVFTPDSSRLVFRNVVNGFHFITGMGLYSYPLAGASTPSILLPTSSVQEGQLLGRFVLTPDGTRAVYSITTPFQKIWSVPVDRSQLPVEVHGPLPVFRQALQTFQLIDGGTDVLFVADLAAEGQFELHRAPIDASRAPVPLGPPSPPLADVDPAFLVHRGTALVVADWELDEARALWSVRITPGNPAVAPRSVPLRLSAAPAPGSGVPPGVQVGTELVPQFAVTEAASRVVYLSDEAVPGRIELFSAPLDASQAPTRLNAPLATSLLPLAFRLDAPGQRVVYAAPDAQGALRLHVVPVDGSTAAVPLGGPFVPGGALWNGGASVRNAFALSDDARTAVYVADADTVGVLELYAVPLDGSQPARRLSHTPVAGGDVRVPPGSFLTAPFALQPGGRWVAYLADQDQDEVFELFLSSLDGPPRVRPSAPPR